MCVWVGRGVRERESTCVCGEGGERESTCVCVWGGG